MLHRRPRRLPEEEPMAEAEEREQAPGLEESSSQRVLQLKLPKFVFSLCAPQRPTLRRVVSWPHAIQPLNARNEISGVTSTIKLNRQARGKHAKRIQRRQLPKVGTQGSRQNGSSNDT